jgi:hypothetical protein
VDQQSALLAKPSTREVPCAIEASIATLCEIDLSPGTLIAPLIELCPLIRIVLDIATSGMLHNVTPCDYLAYDFAPCIKAQQVRRNGIPLADD